MTITAALSTTVLEATPSGTAGCDLRVTNTGSEQATVDVDVAGPAAGWTVLLPASLVLAPGGSARSRVVVEVPRANDRAATEHDLAMKVRVRQSAEPVIELTARVCVIASCALRVSVTPLVARGRGTVTYTVTVANDGTGPRRVGLEVRGPGDSGLRVEAASTDLVVEAGGLATTEVTVKPRRAALSGPSRSHGIVVRARPDAGPMATAAATHFQEPVRWQVAAAAIVAGGAVVVGLVAATVGTGATSPSPPPPAAAGGPPTSIIAASACPDQKPDAPARVDIAGFAFCPAPLTVPAGAEVVWANADLSPHTATFEGDGSVDSGLIAHGQTWSRRFDQPGLYRYYCSLHPGMSGTIVVT